MNEPSKTKILIIDDEQGLADMLSYALPRYGYDVVTARGGQEAIEKARREPFQLAVCDIMMPGGMNGVQTLKALKEVRPETEVVMATGYATLETAIESMKLGAFDYISKPYEIDQLAAILGKALERYRLKSRISELEQLNRLKSEFLANMSHELRTPLNAIVGYTSLLLDNVYGAMAPAQTDALRRVSLSSKNLLELINNILDYSKLNAGMMPVFVEEVDIAAIVKEVGEIMQSLALEKHLTLDCRVRGPIKIKSDKTKIRQILINLVGNALKFTSAGGVTISAAAGEGDAGVVLEVKDTGPGIAEKDIPTIFEEFRQLDGAATRKHGGTGLGLSITKKLVELLRGSIRVESTVGVGTTFIIGLHQTDTVRPETLVIEPPSLPAAHDPQGRVLLSIDDDPEILKLLRDSLQGSGYRLVGASTGEEGLAMARKIKPFAITLDIMMPHRDGWSVLQELKKDPELRSTPVIVLSIMENKALGYALGVTDYIVKPFDRQVLLEKLKELDVTKEKKILVVDDEAEMVELLGGLLRGDGYKVSTALDGHSALEQLKKDKPDLMFLDLTLPGLSGFEVLREMDKTTELKDIPVIVLTAQHLSPKELEELERRVGLVIQKGSISVTKILEELRRRLVAISGGIHDRENSCCR